MYDILIADDEERIRKAVREYAEFEGYRVSEARDGIEAVDLVRKDDFDVAILDIMMPRLDGYSACKEIKKLKDIPVLLLSARSEEFDKLFGFELGIDDYVVKPFSAKELMARVRVIINRNRAKGQENTDLFRYDGLMVDFKGRQVLVNGKNAPLTPKEYDLLFFLVRHPNTAFTRDALMNNVWGYDAYYDDRTVDAHIKMLRSNLKEYRELIVTLRGMGYKFEARN